MVNTTTGSAALYTDFQGLESLKMGAEQRSPEAIKAVSQQFEALFMQMMLKSMRDASQVEGLFESDQSETYLDLHDKQLITSLSSSANGIGLADIIARQLGGGEPPPSKEELVELMPPQRRADTFRVNSAPLSSNLPASMPVDTMVETTPVAATTTSTHQSPLPPTVLDRAVSNAVVTRIDQRRVEGQPLSGVDPEEAVAPIAVAEPSLDTPEQFIAQLWPLAEEAGSRLGVDPKVLLAQAALETGWGRHVIRDAEGKNSHNLFNIKAGSSWQGESMAKRTLEFSGGVAHQEVAPFRAYESYQQSFTDYVDFLQQRPRYAQALASAADSPRYLQELQQAGYATDPDYAVKIQSILEREQFSFAIESSTRTTQERAVNG